MEIWQVMSATSKQRYKRLTPRFYPSEGRWCVDIPPDLNAGHRGRKFFRNLDEAFQFTARLMKISRMAENTKLSKAHSVRLPEVVDNYLKQLRAERGPGTKMSEIIRPILWEWYKPEMENQSHRINLRNGENH